MRRLRENVFQRNPNRQPHQDHKSARELAMKIDILDFDGLMDTNDFCEWLLMVEHIGLQGDSTRADRKNYGC